MARLLKIAATSPFTAALLGALLPRLATVADAPNRRRSPRCSLRLSCGVGLACRPLVAGLGVLVVIVTFRPMAQAETFTSMGPMITVAGTGSQGYSGDGGPAISAQLRYPYSMTVSAFGDIYVSDTGNHRIRRIDRQTRVITTVVGTGSRGFSGDGGPGTAAQINGPTEIIFDSNGDLLIADFCNHRIRTVQPGADGRVTGASDETITTIAGSGPTVMAEDCDNSGGFTGDGGPATEARFNGPQALAFDSAGRLYIGDRCNNRVRRIDVSGIVSTVAGSGSIGCGAGGFSGDGGPATSARLHLPTGLDLGPDGSIYIGDIINHRIRRVNPDGIITTFAGSACGGTFGGDEGPATDACLNQPHATRLDSIGRVYFVEFYNHRVRVVYPDGLIDTAAGNGLAASTGDGQAPDAASIHHPLGIEVDRHDRVFVADTYGHKIRMFPTRYPDADADSLPDAWEALFACTDPSSWDEQFDPDLDGLDNSAEYEIGTDPCLADSDGDSLLDGGEVFITHTDPTLLDTDGDACSDGEELGTNRLFGGDRDPLDLWDFYDVSGDQSIDLTDALMIKQNFGQGPGDSEYDPLYDRAILDLAKPWRTSQSTDGIDLTDVLNNLQSFGHSCEYPP